MSIVSAKDIENSAAVDPVRHLARTWGNQQQSANTLNIEMRAGSGVFEHLRYLSWITVS